MSKIELRAKTKRASKTLTDTSARMRDLSPVMRSVAASVDKLMDDSFRQSRSPDGTPWAPLAPATIEARLNKRNRTRAGRRNKRALERAGLLAGAVDVKPLIDTGRYRRSHHADALPRSIVFGTNTDYQHQLATKNRPARPTMPVEPTGAGFRLMTRGPAALVWRKARQQILRFIREGTVR